MMPQRKGNPDRDFSADYKAALSAEPLPPYELDPDAELTERMAERVGKLIARAMVRSTFNTH